MNDGEIETSHAHVIPSTATKRATDGLAFLNERYPGWHKGLNVFDIYVGDNKRCPAALASGKRYQDFAAELQTEDPETYTTQWFFDHGFYHHFTLEPETSDGAKGPSPGYHILNEEWRNLVSFDQVVQSGTN